MSSLYEFTHRKAGFSDDFDIFHDIQLLINDSVNIPAIKRIFCVLEIVVAELCQS